MEPCPKSPRLLHLGVVNGPRTGRGANPFKGDLWDDRRGVDTATWPKTPTSCAVHRAEATRRTGNGCWPGTVPSAPSAAERRTPTRSRWTTFGPAGASRPMTGPTTWFLRAAPATPRRLTSRSWRSCWARSREGSSFCTMATTCPTRSRISREAYPSGRSSSGRIGRRPEPRARRNATGAPAVSRGPRSVSRPTVVAECSVRSAGVPVFDGSRQEMRHFVTRPITRDRLTTPPLMVNVEASRGRDAQCAA